MHHLWAASTLVLALCVSSATPSSGQQDTQPKARKYATLGQNYPNPFNPDTFIPFTIDDCNSTGGQRVVSLRVYNVLAQLVSVPELKGASRPLLNLKLSCGEYLAYWNGRMLKGRRKAVSGVYVYELVVDGQRTARKMFVSR